MPSENSVVAAAVFLTGVLATIITAIAVLLHG
jgi:hypothetical protein